MSINVVSKQLSFLNYDTPQRTGATNSFGNNVDRPPVLAEAINIIAMEEIWKDVEIIGLRRKYQISNLGVVKRCGRPSGKSTLGRNRKSFIDERILTPTVVKDGYLDVQLRTFNKKQKHVRLHRLVALHYIPNPENKPEVNHKDGNKLNNCALNLEWCTQQENISHAYSSGLSKHGEKHWRSKLTNIQVSEIKKLFLTERSDLKISKIYNTTPGAIYNIRAAITWKRHKE